MLSALWLLVALQQRKVAKTSHLPNSWLLI
jgi:hypothetical protein